MSPQARELQKLGERPGTEHSLRAFRGTMALQHLDLRLLASRAVREYVSIV